MSHEPTIGKGQRPLHILHVAAGLWQHTGGPTVFVAGICAGLARAGCRVTLVTLDGPLADAVHACEAAGVEIRPFTLSGSEAIGYSRQMAAALPQLVTAAELVHSHGLWQYPNWLAGRQTAHTGRPLVISPHGCLNQWCLRKSQWKKRVISGLFGDRILRGAACLHATALSEQEGFRQYGLCGPTTVVPLGIDPTEMPGEAKQIYARFPACRGKRLLLYLSRIHPVKGVLNLVAAWRVLAATAPDWHLLIAGPEEEGYLAEVLEAVTHAGLTDRVTYAGPLYGADRAAAFAAAELYVLPTFSENFGVAIAEALAAGLPVITTHGAPWEGLTTHRCGWWVPVGVEGLVAALREALTRPVDELAIMGNRGREWMLTHFTWEAVACDMLATYRWILGQGPQPAHVYTPLTDTAHGREARG